jgi:hypothetical protein
MKTKCVGLIDDITKEYFYKALTLEQRADIRVLITFPLDPKDPWMRRVYGDEIPLPTEEFCIDRALYFHKHHWPVACAWQRLGYKMFERGLTK